MMRDVKKYRYIFAAVITIVIFTLGMLFSNFVDGQRYSSLRNEIQNDNVELESWQLQLSYLRSEDVDSCGALQSGLQDVVSNYNSRLDDIQNYEKNSFFRENDFESMKNLYVLSGLRYWMFAEELKDNCEYDANTVLYFTTQIGEAKDCDACGYTGEQLSILKQKYGEELLIFTVPTEFDDGFVDMLETRHNVTEIPTIIINDNKTNRLSGSVSSQEIESNLWGED